MLTLLIQMQEKNSNLNATNAELSAQAVLEVKMHI